MEKMLFRKRMLNSGIFCIIVNVIDIVACYYNLLQMYKRGIIDSVTFNENIITGDFHSLLQYGVVYMFMFLLYIDYVVGNDRIENLVRYKNRRKYFYVRVRMLVTAVLEFVLIHELTSVIFVFLFGDWRLLVKHNWLEGVMFQVITAAIYYFLTFFILTIFGTKYNKNTSLVITTIIMSLQYYIFTKIYSLLYMPIADVGIMINICIEQYSCLQCGMAVVRLLAITIILGFICLEMKEREDIFWHE